MRKCLAMATGACVCIAIASAVIFFAGLLAVIFDDIRQVKSRGKLKQEQILMKHELEMNELKLRNAALKEALENFNSKHPKGGEG